MHMDPIVINFELYNSHLLLRHYVLGHHKVIFFPSLALNPRINLLLKIFWNMEHK